MSARPLFKVDRDRRIGDLRSELAVERKLRRDAEANARRFHALLIAERVKHLPEHTNGSGRTSPEEMSAARASQEKSR